MDAAEALRKIEEIHQVIEGSNKAIFSWQRMVMNGVVITLIPLIERSTNYLSFGVDFGSNAELISAVIHTAFYWGLFSLIDRLAPFAQVDRSALHPAVQNAFGISSIFLPAIFGTILVFTMIDHSELMQPVIFLLSGMLFSLYGRFSIPAVSYIAKSYIVIGLAGVYLSQHIHGLWLYMTAYLGLTYIAMGFFLKREKLG